MALCRIASALKPGGLFLLRDLIFFFSPGELDERVEAWLAESSVPSPETGWTRQEFETHLREEHSAFSWLLEEMFEHARLGDQAEGARRVPVDLRQVSLLEELIGQQTDDTVAPRAQGPRP